MYAADVLLTLAQLPRAAGQPGPPLASLLAEGEALFSALLDHNQQFTATLRWGEFLLTYARLAGPLPPDAAVLTRAAEKLHRALELGEGYYSAPYLGLAQVALLQGQPAESQRLLRECQAHFTAQLGRYDWAEVLADETYRGLWPLLPALLAAPASE